MRERDWQERQLSHSGFLMVSSDNHKTLVPLRERVWGRSLVWGLHRRASEPGLGAHLGCEDLGQAVAGAPRV